MPKKTSTKTITRTPNEEQSIAINFDSGVASVYAGPGSGKSFVLTERYIRLLQNGVPNEETLLLSFTSTAAKNLLTRVEERIGKISAERKSGSCTFHGLALAFAQSERHEFNFELADFPLCDEPQANRLSGEAARRHEVDPRNLRSYVSIWKRKRLRPSSVVKSCEDKLDAKGLKLALAYKKYDALLRENGILDFDSLMFEMVDILSRKPAVLERWQYQHIMADESQDNCLNDWELLKLLSSKYGNLLCVGDPGQACYGFRGAEAKLFLEMDKMFPGTQKLFLATNYRSTKQLVGFLKGIGPVPELAEKFTTPNDEGVRPEVVGFRNSAEEAAYVISKIKEGL